MPAYPHRIRLRGPWDWDLPAGATEASKPAQGRVTMPCSLEQAGILDQTGPIRFTRRFGLPGRLDPGEHVWLVFQVQARQTNALLNDHRLAEFLGSGQFAVECTGVLLERNQLDVVLQPNSNQDGLTGETFLEIRRAAYLQNAQARRLPDGRVTASVQLTGKPEPDLDLYLLSDRRTLAHGKVEVPAHHSTVDLTSEESVAEDLRSLRLELVQGGVVWYQLEIAII